MKAARYDMVRTKRMFFTACLLMIITVTVSGQESILGLLKSDLKLAEEYFQKRNYQRALSLYQEIARKGSATPEAELQIARCFFLMKQYGDAAASWEVILRKNKNVPSGDLYRYAETLSSLARYKDAIDIYKQYLLTVPDDMVVIKKIWRLDNIHFLYEDSLHFALRPIGINTTSGELCAMPYQDGVAFLSNRREPGIVEKVDATLNTAFYKIFYSKILPDSGLSYGKPVSFSRSLGARFHVGPFCFFDGGKKIVFAETSETPDGKGERNLQLTFAENRSGSWEITNRFPHNHPAYSFTEPSISEDGTILYFSSDMDGGIGGRDIYRSELVNGEWSTPVNLGDQINTTADEMFPRLHLKKMLYFSSNGHPGLGGLDIFKAEITREGFGEAQNMGYPVNTNHDEFGIVLDSFDTHGYLSSNRKNGGYDDDIYEFDIDLQVYPLVINGRLRYKEHSWSDSSELKTLTNTKLSIIDNIRNTIVSETFSDASGNFSIAIPYFSKYKVKVLMNGVDEYVISLAIPKHRAAAGEHDMVVIKDEFRSHENQIVK